MTEGSHDITANRDMRDALGALGPVDGLNPELSNLTCSITEVDILFGGYFYCDRLFLGLSEGVDLELSIYHQTLLYCHTKP